METANETFESVLDATAFPDFTGAFLALAKYIVDYFYPATITAQAGLRIVNL
ncbi:hypothetical protein [Bacillus mojavensis]|uniref:hypothetical protein n=1 Tax=Bacillus mojavensis TaxID=72360 RepID=UPI002DBC501F|nr:hypothetical protein [Bacillus mojavensis]MEC1673748.1 hypothetical protein [Bacillus mojavensis]